MKKKENEKEEDVKEEEREPRERRCFQCKDMGHVRRDCPEYRHLRQRAAGGPGKNLLTSFRDETTYYSVLSNLSCTERLS